MRVSLAFGEHKLIFLEFEMAGKSPSNCGSLYYPYSWGLFCHIARLESPEVYPMLRGWLQSVEQFKKGLDTEEKQRPMCSAAVSMVRRYDGSCRDAEGSSFYSLTSTLYSSCPHWSIPARAHHCMLGNNLWKQGPPKAQRSKPSSSLSTFETGLVEVLTHPNGA